MKVFSGYVLGVDSKKMYSIILDNEEEKTYQMDCELEFVTEDVEEVQAERKFNLTVTEEGEMSFEFLNEKINENITVQDLKDNMGIVTDDGNQVVSSEERNAYIDEYIAKGDIED
jgi:hypothetical protein